MEVLITIIIPIYKVEKYLHKCIDSVIEQTYTNLEIILVDDGSPDNCPKICDEYAKKDKRIKVIHKKNGGLSDARNVAIKIANGEFIFLLDSDDTITNDAIEYMYNLAKKENAEIVSGQYNKVYEGINDEIIIDNDNYIKIYNTKEALESMLYDSYITNMGCNKLYKKDLFNNIEFPIGKLYEDLGTTYKLISKSNKIVVTSKKTYNYLINRNGSIMNKKFEPNRMQALTFTEEILDFIQKKYKDIENAAKARLYSECIAIFVQIPNNKDFIAENKKIKYYLKKYRKDILFDKKISKKQKIMCIVAIFGKKPLKLVWNLKENIKKIG